MPEVKTIRVDSEVSRDLTQRRSASARLQNLAERLSTTELWVPSLQILRPDVDVSELISSMENEVTQIREHLGDVGRPPQTGRPTQSSRRPLVDRLPGVFTGIVPDSAACPSQLGARYHPSDGALLTYSPPDDPGNGEFAWRYKQDRLDGPDELVDSPDTATGMAFKAWADQWKTDPIFLIPFNFFSNLLVLEYTFPPAPCEATLTWFTDLIVTFPRGILDLGRSTVNFKWVVLEDAAGDKGFDQSVLQHALLEQTTLAHPPDFCSHPTLRSEVGSFEGSFRVQEGAEAHLYVGLDVWFWVTYGASILGGWPAFPADTSPLDTAQLTVRTPISRLDSDLPPSFGVGWIMEPV